MTESAEVGDEKFSKSSTVEPRSKASAYRAMPAYKAFTKNPQIIFCSAFYIDSKEFSL